MATEGLLKREREKKKERKNLGTSGREIEHSVQKHRQNTKLCLINEAKKVVIVFCGSTDA